MDLSKADDEELIKELADRMDLDGKDRAQFRHICLTRCGYEAHTGYAKRPDGDTGKETGTREPRQSGWFKT